MLQTLTFNFKFFQYPLWTEYLNIKTGCELKDNRLRQAASLNRHKIPRTTVQTAMLNRLLATTNGFIPTGCFMQSLPPDTHISNYTIHLLYGNRIRVTSVC